MLKVHSWFISEYGSYVCDSIVANFNVATPLTAMALFDMNLI